MKSFSRHLVEKLFALLILAALACAFVADIASAREEAVMLPQPPLPLAPGAKVIPLWKPGSPTLENNVYQKEAVNYYKTNAEYIQRVTNINNPSIELHLAPADKANGTAIIIAPGGGNKELWVGPEGVEVAQWLNSIGTSAFVLRYRLQPYRSAVDALADTQRAVRLVRANAKDWGVDPKKIGVMGFSAGGEQAARVALHFDAGDPHATDAAGKVSDRPDFVVLVYAGWREMDLSTVPRDAPPAFLTCAGLDDASHARQTVDFYHAWFEAKIPVELHIYGHGGHGGSISPRKGIPFGTWKDRFVDWAADLGVMRK
jgi:endo-1,4-beta-xylanase